MDRGLIIDETKKIILIPLRNKYKTIVTYGIVDLDDYDKIKDIRWCKTVDSDGKEYISGLINGTVVKLHNIINGNPPPGYVNDHKYSNGLDNRKSMLNLRTNSENSQNRIKESGKYTSDYTGVFNNYGIYSSSIYSKEKLFI